MIKGSLYEKYAKERESCDILENENAFLAYRIIGEECFIQDLFVDIDQRKSGKCRELMELLREVALGAECKAITGNLFLIDSNFNQTLIAALLIGFKVIFASPQGVTISLSLEDS